MKRILVTAAAGLILLTGCGSSGSSSKTFATPQALASAVGCSPYKPDPTAIIATKTMSVGECGTASGNDVTILFGAQSEITASRVEAKALEQAFGATTPVVTGKGWAILVNDKTQAAQVVGAVGGTTS